MAEAGDFPSETSTRRVFVTESNVLAQSRDHRIAERLSRIEPSNCCSPAATCALPSQLALHVHLALLGDYLSSLGSQTNVTKKTTTTTNTRTKYGLVPKDSNSMSVKSELQLSEEEKYDRQNDEENEEPLLSQETNDEDSFLHWCYFDEPETPIHPALEYETGPILVSSMRSRQKQQKKSSWIDFIFYREDEIQRPLLISPQLETTNEPSVIHPRSRSSLCQYSTCDECEHHQQRNHLKSEKLLPKSEQFHTWGFLSLLAGLIVLGSCSMVTAKFQSIPMYNYPIFLNLWHCFLSIPFTFLFAGLFGEQQKYHYLTQEQQQDQLQKHRPSRTTTTPLLMTSGNDKTEEQFSSKSGNDADDSYYVSSLLPRETIARSSSILLPSKRRNILTRILLVGFLDAISTTLQVLATNFLPAPFLVLLPPSATTLVVYLLSLLKKQYGLRKLQITPQRNISNMMDVSLSKSLSPQHYWAYRRSNIVTMVGLLLSVTGGLGFIFLSVLQNDNNPKYYCDQVGISTTERIDDGKRSYPFFFHDGSTNSSNRANINHCHLCRQAMTHELCMALNTANTSYRYNNANYGKDAKNNKGNNSNFGETRQLNESSRAQLSMHYAKSSVLGRINSTILVLGDSSNTTQQNLKLSKQPWKGQMDAETSYPGPNEFITGSQEDQSDIETTSALTTSRIGLIMLLMDDNTSIILESKNGVRNNYDENGNDNGRLETTVESSDNSMNNTNDIDNDEDKQDQHSNHHHENVCQWIPFNESIEQREYQSTIVWSLILVASMIPLVLSSLLKQKLTVVSSYLNLPAKSSKEAATSHNSINPEITACKGYLDTSPGTDVTKIIRQTNKLPSNLNKDDNEYRKTINRVHTHWLHQSVIQKHQQHHQQQHQQLQKQQKQQHQQQSLEQKEQQQIKQYHQQSLHPMLQSILDQPIYWNSWIGVVQLSCSTLMVVPAFYLLVATSPSSTNFFNSSFSSNSNVWFGNVFRDVDLVVDHNDHINGDNFIDYRHNLSYFDASWLNVRDGWNCYGYGRDSINSGCHADTSMCSSGLAFWSVNVHFACTCIYKIFLLLVFRIMMSTAQKPLDETKRQTKTLVSNHGNEQRQPSSFCNWYWNSEEEISPNIEKDMDLISVKRQDVNSCSGNDTATRTSAVVFGRRIEEYVISFWSSLKGDRRISYTLPTKFSVHRLLFASTILIIPVSNALFWLIPQVLIPWKLFLKIIPISQLTFDERKYLMDKYHYMGNRSSDSNGLVIFAVTWKENIISLGALVFGLVLLHRSRLQTSKSKGRRRTRNSAAVVQDPECRSNDEFLTLNQELNNEAVLDDRYGFGLVDTKPNQPQQRRKIDDQAKSDTFSALLASKSSDTTCTENVDSQATAYTENLGSQFGDNNTITLISSSASVNMSNYFINENDTDHTSNMPSYITLLQAWKQYDNSNQSNVTRNLTPSKQGALSHVLSSTDDPSSQSERLVHEQRNNFITSRSSYYFHDDTSLLLRGLNFNSFTDERNNVVSEMTQNGNYALGQRHFTQLQQKNTQFHEHVLYCKSSSLGEGANQTSFQPNAYDSSDKSFSIQDKSSESKDTSPHVVLYGDV